MSIHYSSTSLPEVTVESLAVRLQEQPEQLQLLDVREPEEVAIARLAEFQNLPLSEFADWSIQIHQLLDLDRETYVLCHHGLRSAQVCQWLIRQGFTAVKNVAGGIDAYARRVDPSIPRY